MTFREVVEAFVLAKVDVEVEISDVLVVQGEVDVFVVLKRVVGFLVDVVVSAVMFVDVVVKVDVVSVDVVALKVVLLDEVVTFSL